MWLIGWFLTGPCLYIHSFDLVNTFHDLLHHIYMSWISIRNKPFSDTIYTYSTCRHSTKEKIRNYLTYKLIFVFFGWDLHQNEHLGKVQQQVCLFVCAEFQVKSDCEKGRWPSWAEHIDLHGKRGALTMHNLPTAVSTQLAPPPLPRKLTCSDPAWPLSFFKT